LGYDLASIAELFPSVRAALQAALNDIPDHGHS
jgi:hypothetical protein